MGCVSSKLARTDLKREILFSKGNYSNHIVSLTSSTDGALQLDATGPNKEPKKSPPHLTQKKVPEQEPEIINTWELMQDLEDEIPKIPISPPAKTVLKSHVFMHTVSEFDGRKQTRSPKRQKKFEGKENDRRRECGPGSGGRLDFNEKQVLRPFSSLENSKPAAPRSEFWLKNAPANIKIQRNDSGLRRSFSPLFDPDLLESMERELSEEGEQIKKMLSPIPKSRKSRESETMLESFQKRCPPGGENAVVLYTTTLRGIRKTFEDCNAARSVIESYGVRTIERDVSMDSGFREELRVLMVQKEVRVPMAFVKGRLIGCADEVMKLEEEGKLGILLESIPRATPSCDGCGGMRFVMCMDCSGSCKVLDEDKKKMMKCGECNENGLIRCPHLLLTTRRCRWPSLKNQAKLSGGLPMCTGCGHRPVLFYHQLLLCMVHPMSGLAWFLDRAIHIV